MLNQILFDASLRASGPTIYNKLVSKILAVIKKVIIAFYDPTVTYNYLDYPFKIPLSHDLPFPTKNFPTYNKNLTVIAKLVSEKYPSSTVIDVGANIGDSVANIRQGNKLPVLAVEGNKKFLSLLKINTFQFEEITIAPFFIGEEGSRATPTNYLGSSYLSLSEEGESLQSLDAVIDTYPYFKNTKLLKTDTDGFDTKVIRSSTRLLDEQRPVLFFEYDPYFLAKQGEVGLEIFAFLNHYGYESVILFDNIGRLVSRLSLTNDMNTLRYLDRYFNQHSEHFLDICAVTSQDNDIADKIVTAYF